MLNWRNTITIYNKYKVTVNNVTTYKWHKTVLKNCFLGNSVSYSGADYQKTKTPRNIVRIPKSDNYADPGTYNGTGFTLNVGDIIVHGNCADNIADNTDGQSILDGKRAFVLTNVKDNTYEMAYTPHYWGSD